MINPRELCVSNIIQNKVSGVLYVVTVELLDEIIKEGGSRYEGVPLTDEVFKLTGLVANGSLYSSPVHIQKESSKDIGIKYLSFWFNKRLNRWMEVQTRICIDYVHELQNLYFIAAKEELYIDL